VNGACVFTSRAVLEKVRLIPEDYFLYFEDCEWGLRATRLGFKNYVSYRNRVHHHREVGAFNPVAEYYCRRNAFLFKKRNGFLRAWSKPLELLRLQKAALKAWIKKDAKMLEILRAVKRDVRDEKSGLGPWR
jgi:GT2 family glycosyltransferase